MVTFCILKRSKHAKIVVFKVTSEVYSSVFRTFVDIFGNYVQKSSESCWKSLAVAGTFPEIPVMER